jgi:hypothetical protein
MTVKAFVGTWLLGTRQWGSEPEYKVVVLFPGETAEGLANRARTAH